jgi:capsid protein
VPATDVIHVYRDERPGQMTGVPWLSPVMALLHDLGDFLDAELMRAKVASLVVAMVTDMSGSKPEFGLEDEEDEGLLHMEPGGVVNLGPGQDVKFNSPTLPHNTDFVRDHLRGVAAGMDLPYEALTGDYRGATFSSARMARQEHRADVAAWRNHMLIPQMLVGIWNWVMPMAAAMRGWGEVPTAEWIAPPLPSVEPDKEPGVFAAELRSGMVAPSVALRRRGVADFDAHVGRLEADWEKIRAANLVRWIRIPATRLCRRPLSSKYRMRLGVISSISASCAMVSHGSQCCFSVVCAISCKSMRVVVKNQ